MYWKIYLVLSFGLIFWLYAELNGNRAFRIIAGIVSFLWVSYWGISLSDKTTYAETKIFIESINLLSSLKKDDAALVDSLKIYKNEKKKSEVKAALKMNNYLRKHIKDGI